MGMFQDQKDVANARKKQARDKAPQHDSLHGKYETCYCVRPCCFYSWEHRKEDGTKVTLGICICTDCPCETPRIAGIRSGMLYR